MECEHLHVTETIVLCSWTWFKSALVKSSFLKDASIKFVPGNFIECHLTGLQACGAFLETICTRQQIWESWNNLTVSLHSVIKHKSVPEITRLEIVADRLSISMDICMCIYSIHKYCQSGNSCTDVCAHLYTYGVAMTPRGVYEASALICDRTLENVSLAQEWHEDYLSQTP